MQKRFLPLLMVLIFACVACTESVEDRAREYAARILTAEKCGDTVTMVKLQEQAQEWTDGLSAEDQHKVLKAIVDVYKEKEKAK